MLLLLLLLQDGAGPWLDDAWRLPEFSLTERSGRTVTRKDLIGKVWIVDFIFTHCAGPCPMMSHQMRKLQEDLPADVHLLSFSVDPKRDTPEVLREYADALKADRDRWLFVTGDKETIFSIALDAFKVTAKDPQQGSDQIIHSTRFFIVDPQGRIRRFYNYAPLDDEEGSVAAMKTIREDALKVLKERPLVFGVIPRECFPRTNAILNGTSAVLLLIGLALIKSKRIGAHKACMLTALVVSTLFLVSYLIYHWQVGSVRFSGEGAARTVYLTILFSHTILAVVLVPLILVTLVRAFKGNFERHKGIARITFPVWLYVSVTGVVVYFMLYHWQP